MIRPFWPQWELHGDCKPVVVFRDDSALFTERLLGGTVDNTVKTEGSVRAS